MERQQLIERIGYYWNQLNPKQRQKSFRLGNKPFVYSNWENLLDVEKDIIINAARIIGTWGRG